MRYWGLDPGSSGAVAWYSPETGEYESLSMRPAEKVFGEPPFIVAELVAYMKAMRDADEPSLMMIERVGASRTADRQQGGTSMFTFGMATGCAWGVVEALFPGEVVTVMPTVWKRHMGLLGQPKDASIAKASEIFPGYRDLIASHDWKKSQSSGRADALLIAKYASEVYGPNAPGVKRK